MTRQDVAVVSGYHDDVRSDVLPWVPASSGRLVDIGGGTGATASHFKASGRASVAGSVDQVTATAPGLDFACRGDLEDVSFLEGALATHGPFDTVLCLDILEHLVDPWQTIGTLHKALAPGGHLVASIPNVRHFRVAGGLLFRGRWDLQDAGVLDRTHLRFFVRTTAVELVTHTGLQLVQVAIPPRMRHPRAASFLHRIGRGRLDDLVAVDYVIVVRRVD